MEQIKFMVVAILLLAAFSNCKKDDKPKDDTSPLKNTIWTGEFHYTAQSVQPMSVEFKEGGQFIWHELAGPFPGTWKIENRKLTVSFATGSGFTADISNNNKLTNFAGFPGNNYVVDNAALNKDSDAILDNTTWIGGDISITFKPGNLLDIKQDVPFIIIGNNIPYIRKSKSFRFILSAYNYGYFLVSNGAAVMKGARYYTPVPTSVRPFELKKQ